jgi:2-dehydropantoate 2-reductase
MVCRSNYNIVSQQGFIIESPETYGTYKFTPDRVFSSCLEAAEIEWDYILVTTKNVSEVERVSSLISPLVQKGDPLVVLMQNGVGIEKEVQSVYPSLKLASCVLYLAVTQTVPGIQINFKTNSKGIIKFGDGSIQNFVIGLYSGPHFSRIDKASKAQDSVEKLYILATQVLKASVKMISPPSLLSENVELQAVRFHKTSWNLAFGVLCILTNMDTLALLEDPGTFSALGKLFNEVFLVASKHLNIEFPPPGLFTVSEYLERSRGIGAYRPSIQVDHDNHRAMEIEVIIGNVYRIAQDFGLDVPLIEFGYQSLRMVQRKRMNQKFI